MSQVILDEQMDRQRVLYPLRAWIPATTVTDLFPNEVIKDDRIPTILRQLKQPTFVTIDAGFWRKKLCDPRYCLVYFALTEDQQNLIPVLLRRLLRHPEFKSKAVRMGKVIRMSRTRIDYWQWGDDRIHHLGWPLES